MSHATQEPASAAITASMLYDLVQCPRRVELDVHGDPARRDPVGRFVELLWERGTTFERETIAGLGEPYLDLSVFPAEEKERRTREALARGERLIRGGRLSAADLVGEPDLLRREDDGSPGAVGGDGRPRYVPIDVKSGAGEEVAGDPGTQKPHYAMQLSLYVDVLERAGHSAGRRAIAWDAHGARVVYDLEAPRGRKHSTTWWKEYERMLARARAIVARVERTEPALTSKCKLCHWRTECRARLEASDDLTLIPELGRDARDKLRVAFPTIADFATADLAPWIRGSKTTFGRLGRDRLLDFQARARLLKSPHPRPYRKAAFSLPRAERELFFDIEVDPLRDLCYLHGFVERTVDGRGASAERYVACFAESATREGERRAFAEAWEFVARSRPCAIYYYSPYEHTFWRRLQARHPGVCSAAEVEDLFADPATIDLYTDVVRVATEWPTHDTSIKTLAKLLGFAWRDSEPSGAASIEWYHRYVDTGDEALRRRLLDYNEDDCRATRVLLDGLRRLEPGP